MPPIKTSYEPGERRMETTSQHLSVFTEQLEYEAIPSRVIDRVKLHILDIIGIGLAAADMPFARIILETLREWGGVAQSTVLRYGDRLPAPSAVLANGSFTHGLDFDDTHASD